MMKLTKKFSIPFVIFLVFFILPTLLTFNAPASDGLRVYGFPLSFYTQGGYCIGPCPHEFKVFYFLIDLVILFGAPLLINWFFQRK